MRTPSARALLLFALPLTAPAFAQHPNDECTTPATLLANTPFAFDTTLATAATGMPCVPSAGKDIWFVYLVNNPIFDVALCNSSYDTVVEVLSGVCPNLASVACNDDSCGLRSTLSFTNQFVTGEIVYIRVGGFNGAGGLGQIVVNSAVPCKRSATSASSCSRSATFALSPSVSSSFSLIATANHFWLDVLAGIVLAVAGAALAALFTPGMRERGRASLPGAPLSEPHPRESPALSGSPR